MRPAFKAIIEGLFSDKEYYAPKGRKPERILRYGSKTGAVVKGVLIGSPLSPAGLIGPFAGGVIGAGKYNKYERKAAEFKKSGLKPVPKAQYKMAKKAWNG